MTNRLWVLGASDPEMAAIEQLLVAAGEAVAYATVNGVRVHPGNAYKADGFISATVAAPWEGPVYFVECDGPALQDQCQWSPDTVDHHRDGAPPERRRDPGYGLPPEEFLRASSLGQVISHLAQLGYGFPDWEADDTAGPWSWGKPACLGQALNLPVVGVSRTGGTAVVTTGETVAPDERGSRYTTATRLSPDTYVLVPAELLMIAAADHCLESAYRGRCPGVDPDALMRWRAESRAAFQKRTVADVLRDVEAARAILRAAAVAPKRLVVDLLHPADREGYVAAASGSGDEYYDGYAVVADLRGRHVPELPEAAAREGIAFLAAVKDRDGREKVVLQAASPQLVALFLAGGVVAGLVDMYGDPMRGLAGGYL